MLCMDFWEIGRLVSDDRISLEYLWKNHEDVLCTSYSSTDFYFLGRWRVQSKRCGRDIYLPKGTRFSLLRITPSQWLSLIKLFDLFVSARKVAKDLSLSYKTALKKFDLLRRVIVENLARINALMKEELGANESYFGGRRKGKRGRGAGNKTIVFEILKTSRNLKGEISLLHQRIGMTV